MRRYKEFKELDLCNYFLFPAVMEDQELCRDMLEICTGETIARMQVHTEESRQYHPRERALRLDVKAWNPGAQYHSRQPDEGNCHYVIFICTFDPFHSGKYRYIYENLKLEEDRSHEDETYKIYLNTKGTNETEVPETLLHFLKYLEESTNQCAERYKDDLFIQRLHRRVQAVKENRDKEEEYMLFGELLDEREELGEKRGVRLGEERASGKIVRLVSKMMDDGYQAEIRRLDDPDFLEIMMKRYGIK